MNSNSMMGLLDIIVIGAGCYVLYGCYLLMAKNEIKSGLIISKGVNPDKCKDIEGFKKTMGPKTILFGLLAVISGGIGLYQDYVKPVPAPLYWTFYILFIVVLVWYAISCRSAEKKFF